jgi:hypothetical protein
MSAFGANALEFNSMFVILSAARAMPLAKASAMPTHYPTAGRIPHVHAIGSNWNIDGFIGHHGATWMAPARMAAPAELGRGLARDVAQTGNG